MSASKLAAEFSMALVRLHPHTRLAGDTLLLRIGAALNCRGVSTVHGHCAVVSKERRLRLIVHRGLGIVAPGVLVL